MESKNISRHGAQVREYLNRGYSELENGNWEFAKISFDKVIMMEKDNGSAFVGKALASMRMESLRAVIDNGILYELLGELFGVKIYDHYEFYSHNCDEISAAICADEIFRRALAECTYDEACNLVDDKKIERAFDLFVILRDCLGGYEDSGNKLYLCEKYLEIKGKAQQFYKTSKYYKNDEKIIEEELDSLTEEANEINKYKKINLYYLGASWGLVLYIMIASQIDFYGIPFIGDFLRVLPIIVFLFQCVIGYITLKFTLKKDENIWPFVIFGFFGSVKSFMSIKERYENVNTKIQECSDRLYPIEKLKEEFIYKIQTMLGEDIEIFEYEAKGLDFMVGYGNSIIENYTNI